MMSGARSVKPAEKGLTFLDADGKELMTMVPEMAGACNYKKLFQEARPMP